jgi:hypothetical protein
MIPIGMRTRSPAFAWCSCPSRISFHVPSTIRMYSSCVGWMCGGTKVPGGLIASKAKECSVLCLGW